MLALRKLPIRERATRPSASPSCHLSWWGMLVGGWRVCGAVMVMMIMRSALADRDALLVVSAEYKLLFKSTARTRAP